jgi:hypothetical protein
VGMFSPCWVVFVARRQTRPVQGGNDSQNWIER